MDCKNITNYINQSDFDCLGMVAKHCDLSKLCIAIEEAKTFDIIPLFCYDFVDDVLENWNLKQEDQNFDKYQKLICEGVYTDNQGRKLQNLGFKKVWIYYAYARYILINQTNDTANGTVRKQNDWSVPTSLKEVTDISNKYRDMGKIAYDSVHDYLCRNKNDYPKFDACNCVKSCSCSGNCKCGKTIKLTGTRFSSVSK